MAHTVVSTFVMKNWGLHLGIYCGLVESKSAKQTGPRARRAV